MYICTGGLKLSINPIALNCQVLALMSAAGLYHEYHEFGTSMMQHTLHSCSCLIWVYSVRMDGWMTCDFTSFSTVFQSYQADGRLIMKGYVQWNPFLRLRRFRLNGGSNSGPLDQ